MEERQLPASIGGEYVKKGHISKQGGKVYFPSLFLRCFLLGLFLHKEQEGANLGTLETSSNLSNSDPPFGVVIEQPEPARGSKNTEVLLVLACSGRFCLLSMEKIFETTQGRRI